jgi:hypothetical protein
MVQAGTMIVSPSAAAFNSVRSWPGALVSPQSVTVQVAAWAADRKELPRVNMIRREAARRTCKKVLVTIGCGDLMFIIAFASCKFND